MSEEQRRLLQQQLWNIANTLRGKMNADEFRDYILGFIFYKYLSEKIEAYADEILAGDGVTFAALQESKQVDMDMIDAVQDATVEHLGYFLRPSELFHANSRTASFRSYWSDTSFFLSASGSMALPTSMCIRMSR